MIAVSVNVSGLNAALNKMQALPAQIAQVLERTTYRIGALVKDAAKQYAPISPNQSMLNQMRQIRLVNAGYSNKKIRRFKKFGKARRKQSASSRPMPGALQNSITMRNTPDYAEVFVPENSPAGKYAVKIHDEKGQTWRNRGPGTVAKGAQADDKFIERAINDNMPEMDRIIEDQIDKVLKG
jgi:hypothetical protein